MRKLITVHLQALLIQIPIRIVHGLHSRFQFSVFSSQYINFNYLNNSQFSCLKKKYFILSMCITISSAQNPGLAWRAFCLYFPDHSLRTTQRTTWDLALTTPRFFQIFEYVYGIAILKDGLSFHLLSGLTVRNARGSRRLNRGSVQFALYLKCS